MGNVVDLQKLRTDDQLIADCARYAENLFSEADVKKRHHLPADVWESLGNDDAFVERVEAEKLRRIRNGNSKRERAQQHIVRAPDILNTIMSDERASPRHRVDAIKTLDGLAANGPTAAPPEDRYTIVINLGGDERLVFSKNPTPHDSELINQDTDNDTAPQELLPAIAARKDDSHGGGGAPW
jgi:hypothetical protein